MDKGVSKNAPVVIAAQQISQAREKFETMVHKTGAELIFEREARFALEIVQGSYQLQGCDPRTIYDSILNVAAVGLSLNPILGEAALVPRWNKKKNMTDCTLSPMYRGLVRLATESGRVSHVKAELVFEADELKVELGTTPSIHHDPLISILGGESARVVDFIDRKRNKLRAVYCVAHLGSGEKIIGLMSYDEILKTAMCSEAFNPTSPKGKARGPSGPWVEHGGEMAKKSIINREQKTWPRTDGREDKFDTAIGLIRKADEEEGYVSNVTPRTEPEPALEVISPEQAAELRELAGKQNLSETKICETFKVEVLDAMPASEFKAAKAKLVARLEQYDKKRAEIAKAAAEKEKAEEQEPEVEIPVKAKPAPRKRK